MIRMWVAWACRNKRCDLYRGRITGGVGSEPGCCPSCGWLRTLAGIRTERVGGDA
jgi:hypothetical protein